VAADLAMHRPRTRWGSRGVGAVTVVPGRDAGGPDVGGTWSGRGGGHEDWVYLVGRYLVMRQENLGLAEDGVGYNVLKHNQAIVVGTASDAAPTFVNPNLDVVYSEAWIAVDTATPAILEMPDVPPGRYHIAQIVDEWAEITHNIKAGKAKLPTRVDIRTFDNAHLPGAWAFDHAYLDAALAPADACGKAPEIRPDPTHRALTSAGRPQPPRHRRATACAGAPGGLAHQRSQADPGHHDGRRLRRPSRRCRDEVRRAASLRV
jgi:hypothetical protein